MLAVFSNSNADGEVRGDAYVPIRRANSISASDFSPEPLPECKAASLDSRNAYCMALFEQEARKVKADKLAADKARQIQIERDTEWLHQQEQISSSLESSFASASSGSAPSPAYEAGSVEAIITAAANFYGQDPSEAIRVARCESTLGQDPDAYNGNSGHYGLFQFKMSTWNGTPWASKCDVLDNWCNAHGAMWMWSEGRKSEWECQ